MYFIVAGDSFTKKEAERILSAECFSRVSEARERIANHYVETRGSLRIRFEDNWFIILFGGTYSRENIVDTERTLVLRKELLFSRNDDLPN